MGNERKNLGFFHPKNNIILVVFSGSESLLFGQLQSLGNFSLTQFWIGLGPNCSQQILDS